MESKSKPEQNPVSDKKLRNSCRIFIVMIQTYILLQIKLKTKSQKVKINVLQ